MEKVITETAVITCSHQGKVTIPASQRLLTSSGMAVLVQGDEASGTITDCPNKGPGLKPCTKTLPAAAGIATKLQVGERFVLLLTATGPTDSTPSGTWQVKSPGQTKFDAT